jgi:tRNA-Thr(GGU) m(6)t(6)A37 methyltransferase TsaA
MIEMTPIGRVESPLTELKGVPKQGDEGAPDALLVIEPQFADAMEGLQVGQEIVVLTWLDRADREVLQVYPRGDKSRGLQGVFNTRSPARPNPIGLHRVTILSIDESTIEVNHMEAVDGTPILDLKPALRAIDER